MTKNIFLLTALLLLAACGRPQKTAEKQAENPFVNDVLLGTTPVKDQGNSDLCWIYGMLATIETEHIMQGDSVNLSTQYVARQMLQDEIQRYYLHDGGEPMSMRGMMTMTLHLLERHGAMPNDSYQSTPDLDMHVLMRQLQRLGDVARGRRVGLQKLADLEDDMLNDKMGYMPPRFVYMLGAQYTPQEFAHSVCLPHEYEALTSFTHHPFGQRYAIESADNRMLDTFLNVPLDTLMQRIDSALLNGHPVCWEGDVSEAGFRFDLGTARMPHDGSGQRGTQADRQRGYEQLRTTDDHCMALVGLAHDAQGHRYYIAKNSWGKDNPFGGMMYLSENYVRMKTIAVVLRKM